MPEAPHLLDHIDKPLRLELKEMFPEWYRRSYEQALHQILRWGHDPSLPIRPGYTESDLEHTAGMLDMAREWKRNFIYLPQVVNYRTTVLMIAMHDSGEIIVDDAPSHGPLRESPFWVRRKRQEPKMAQRFILSLIPDESVREEMTRLYHRFETQDPNDLEALTTRLFDKMQGTTRVGVKYIFDYRAVGLQEPSEETILHVDNSLSKTCDAALNLSKALPNEGSKEELRQFAIEEISRFERIGFEELARNKKKLLLVA